VTSMDVNSAVDVLRTLLTEDISTFRRLHSELDAGQRQALAVVLTVAFNEAAVRRFGEQHAPADIIGFVAEARGRYPTIGEAVSAEDAETVIRAALGEDDLIDALGGYAFGAAQAAMLFALTNETDAARDTIEPLLASAAGEAEAYLRRRASR
jgi:hypothetical protein